MKKSNSNVPISDILTGDETIFNPLKSRLIIYLFSVVFIIGYIMDLIFIKSNSVIYFIDLASITLSISIIIGFYFRKIEISTVVKLQILLLLVNMVVSNFVNSLNSQEFVGSFLRNTIILFMLIPIFALYGGKRQIFLIGFVYLVIYSLTLIRAHNPILSSNAPVLIFSAIIFIAGNYLIFDTIEKMHIFQIKLNRNLKKQKEQAEIQNAQIELLNKELLATNEKLIESNSTKDKLFSIIAHDLRSPFNNILGLSGILIEDINNVEPAQSKKYLGLINSSAQNTLNLLDNLLNWAKAQSGQITIQPEKLSLSSVINEIVEQSNSIAKSKSIILNYTPSDEFEIYSDENMLKLVFRNLISNAIKFTNQGGNINISVISVQKHFEISVSDNGVGMSEEMCKKLFDITTNTTSPGTANERGSGLGLVLCKEFVEKLGGKIWVESEEGKGSDFKFTLPVNE